MIFRHVRFAAAAVACVVLLGGIGLAQDAGAPAGDAGTVAGTVIDRTSGDPIIEAGVEVVGTGKKTTTDLDGKYVIKLPPGKYEVRIYAPLYQGTRLQNVTVQPGKTSKGDAALAAAGQAGVEVVEVTAQAAKAAEATQLVKRKSAAVVMDTVGAESIKKAPGSKATDVVQRTPSVTIKDDKFIVVRGLDERYTSATLNGSRLPSPDPLKRVVPLDLFPAEFFDAFGIIKTYSPDLPGDFTGGLVEMQLRDFPEQLQYNFSVTTGGNTQATGQDFLTYKGSALDYVTLGESYRNPPSTLPDFSLNDLSNSQRFAVGRSFKDIWSPETATAPPNFGTNFSIGNTWGPLGVQFGAVYSTEYFMRRNELKRQLQNTGTTEDPEVSVRDQFYANVGTFNARIGGLLTGAYKFNEKHKLTLRTFVNRIANDETTSEIGTTPQTGDGEKQRQTRLQYIEDELAYSQLAGEHDFDWVRADWRTVLSRVTRDEPDTRHTTYVGPKGDRVFTQDSLGGLRINNETRERLTDSMLDFTVPFHTWLPFTDVWTGLPAKFKFGPAYSFRDRDFAQRRFQFEANGATQNLTKPAEDLFAPNNIGPAGANVEETTQARDRFHATEEIIAGYGMFDLPLVRDRLRLIGGVRLEYSLIRLESFVDNVQNVCGAESIPECYATFRKKNVNPLPGVNLVYSPRDDMNLRFSYSQSVSRPEFRELAPVEFPAQRGDRARFGNPDLVQAEITSWDGRFEWFFTPLEVASIGAFYKELTNPIELVQVVRSSDIAETWANAKDGKLVGVELELRKDFAFVKDWLRPLRFIGNVTYTDSTVNTPKAKIFGLPTQQTSLTRRLQGQAPITINAILEWDKPDVVTASLLYFTAGDTLVSVGSNGVPDTFFQQRHKLDAVVIVPLQRWLDAPIRLKLAAENLLNDPFTRTQGDFVQRNYTSGIKFSLGLAYSY